jgi:hypothetical protein
VFKFPKYDFVVCLGGCRSFTTPLAPSTLGPYAGVEAEEQSCTSIGIRLLNVLFLFVDLVTLTCLALASVASLLRGRCRLYISTDRHLNPCLHYK